MGIARSTFYDKPAPQDDDAIVEVISGIYAGSEGRCPEQPDTARPIEPGG